MDALKYNNPTTGRMRLLRVIDGKFQPPKGSWGDRTYTIAFRGGTDADITPTTPASVDLTPESSRWQGGSDTTPNRFRRQLIKQEFGVVSLDPATDPLHGQELPVPVKTGELCS